MTATIVFLSALLQPASPHGDFSQCDFSFHSVDAEGVVAAGGEHIVTREPTSFVPVRMCELKDCEGNGFELRQFVADGEDLSVV